MDGYEKRVGVFWLGPFSWLKLHRIAVDADLLQDSYEEWLEGVSATLEDLAGRGIAVERVPIDVDELCDFCRAENRPLDAEARAAFVSEKLRQKYEAVH